MIRGGVLLFMTRGLAVGGKITLNNQNPELWCSAIRRNAMHLKERERPIVFVSVLAICLWFQQLQFVLMRSSNEASRGGGHRTANTPRAPTVCADYIIRIYFNNNTLRCKHAWNELESIKGTLKAMSVLEIQTRGISRQNV